MTVSLSGGSLLCATQFSLSGLFLPGSRNLSPCLGLELVTHQPPLTLTALSLAVSPNQTSVQTSAQRKCPWIAMISVCHLFPLGTLAALIKILLQISSMLSVPYLKFLGPVVFQTWGFILGFLIFARV